MTGTVFGTERLVVRRLDGGDAEALFELYRDPEVTRYVIPGGQTAPNIEFIHAQLAEGMFATSPDPRFGFWGVERREDGALAGTAALVPVDDSEGEYEMGWHLAPRYWGQGYAFESGIGLLQYGFGTVGLDEILALVHPENERSLRACRRLGFEPRPPRMSSGYEHECLGARRATWTPPTA